jgi:two-component system, LuxR family, sensor kinase FixL
LRAEVAHSARIGAINAMAATLAHELAQPLTAASNFLVAGQMMIARGAPEEAAQAREAMVLTQRHLKLASDILRRARDMVSGRLRPADDVDLIAAVDDVFMMIAATMAPARVDLVRAIDPAGRWVAADRVQLQQVLTNLVHNACDAAAAVLDRRVTVSSMAAADGVVTVAIADNGPGLPVDFDEAMSPFASTKDAGLGLGLTIAKAIVMAHGGRLWFERSDGPGTTVRFTVPAGVPATA